MPNDIEIVEQQREPLTMSDMRHLMAWSWGKRGLWLADLWDAYNGRYWQGALVPVPIWFPAATPYGHWIGQYTGAPGRTSHHIQIKRGLDEQKTADVLLHEMVHQYLYETGKNTAHNAWPWCEEITRLTKAIWNRDIYVSPSVPRKGQRVQKPGPNGEQSLPLTVISGWPHSIGANAPMK